MNELIINSIQELFIFLSFQQCFSVFLLLVNNNNAAEVSVFCYVECMQNEICERNFRFEY